MHLREGYPALNNVERKFGDTLVSGDGQTIVKGVIHITCNFTLHNHPTGDPAPSGEDISITKRLKEAGELIGIPVLDHIIIGDGQYVSFVERGLL